MTGIFSPSTPSIPKPPPPPPPVRMPDEGDPAAEEARRRRLMEAAARSGRAGTVLSGDSGTGTTLGTP